MKNVSMADLFRESVIFQGVLAVVVIIGTFALLLTGRPVPDYVWMIDAAVIGFFFGAKNLLTARNAAQDANQLSQQILEQNGQIVNALVNMGAVKIGGPVGSVMEQSAGGKGSVRY